MMRSSSSSLVGPTQNRAAMAARDGRHEARRSIQLPLADVLEMQEIVETVDRALAAVPRILDAAERRGLGRESALVDPDDASLQGIGHPPDAAYVLAVEVSRQAEGGVIGGSHLQMIFHFQVLRNSLFHHL